jgi:hypothetical protein
VTAKKDARTVCGAGNYLPTYLVSEAMALETSTRRPAEPQDVQRYLRCTLERHEPGTDHHSLVLELDGPDSGAVWTTWPWDGLPERWQLFVRPDCPGIQGLPCNEYEGHEGGHTPEVQDPWTEVSESLSK